MKKVTPTVIYCLLLIQTESDVISQLSREIFNDDRLVKHHSLGVAINAALDRSSLQGERISSEIKLDELLNKPIKVYASQIIPSKLINNIQEPKTEDNSKLISSKESSKLEISEENIEKVVDDYIISKIDKNEIKYLIPELERKFVAQEEYAKSLLLNIMYNLDVSTMNGISDRSLSTILVDGSSGTGKTSVVEEIADKFDIPIIITSSTEYSAPGYQGAQLDDILIRLYQKSEEFCKNKLLQEDEELKNKRISNEMLQKISLNIAQRGVIVLDEFDKVLVNLEVKEAFQDRLLHFFGGGKYWIDVDKGLFSNKKIEFDTSKLTVICLCALTDLRERQNKKVIGFLSNEQQTDTYTINAEDLINLGFKKELVGRLKVRLHTNDYSKDDYLQILLKSKISPLTDFKSYCEQKGKKLTITDMALDAITTEAFNLKLGVRGLEGIIDNIRNYFLEEILLGDNDIYIDENVVKRVVNWENERKVKK